MDLVIHPCAMDISRVSNTPYTRTEGWTDFDDADVVLTSGRSATFVGSLYSLIRLPQSDVAPRRSDSLNHLPA